MVSHAAAVDSTVTTAGFDLAFGVALAFALILVLGLAAEAAFVGAFVRGGMAANSTARTLYSQCYVCTHLSQMTADKIGMCVCIV
jgi:hypothetical protein